MAVSSHAARSPGAARRLRSWVACASLLLGGCTLSYTDTMQRVDRDLVAQQPQAALKQLESISGGKDQALYLLNKAMVQRMMGDYDASVQSFEQAKPLIQYLEATSVTENAAALTLTENLRAYNPPLYERLLAHVYQGLNYLQLGQADSARVEAAQIDDLLKRLYPNADAAPNGGDAFPRYFSGLVYENMGQFSDAMISYRQAYKSYKAQGASDASIPRDLQESLCRFADFLGLTDELNDYKQRFSLDHWTPVSLQDPDGQLVFIYGDGMGPVKYAQSAVLPDPVNGHFYSVTLPVIRRRTRETYAEISAGGEEATTSQVASIADDAEEQYKADRPKLLAAEFARNVTRAVAANQADKSAPGLGSVLSLVASAVDTADIRNWSTLPDNIQVARLRLPPGTYDLTVRARGGTRVLKDVSIRAGEITFSSLQMGSLQ
jgi:hypothetical protein